MQPIQLRTGCRRVVVSLAQPPLAMISWAVLERLVFDGKRRFWEVMLAQNVSGPVG